ncbi:MAG: undecaprenyl/decaprenyl-phosphate alpha-N-acetylglucosaminyl 1-phosphate transferase [Candidatus Omnitrophica bacterium]|nr:undecaprenyl/decaprenyl-phosphate alpha-N-acetylglucosaminyl 1-phosphate transferase [Candidatus Omnitrophota bacterium]
MFRALPYSQIDIIGAFFISLILSYLLTPAAGLAAMKIGLVDRPSSRKAHAHPTPLLGGVAIFIAFFLAILFTVGMDRNFIAITIGGGILLSIGLIDDKIGMMPELKLFGQLVAALIVVKMGIRVDFIKNYYLSLIFSCVWIIGITNAINILDNLNGLSSGIAAISAFFFSLLAWKRGDLCVATLAIALCGSSMGFLRHNFPKAKIFMGDAGSLFIGFLLATLAILGNWSSPTQITSLAIPILILGYPIFDTILVTISRMRQRRSIFDGGKDHSSHRLALLGLKKKRAVLLIFFINFCLGLSGYILSKLKTPASAILIMVIVFLCMIALGIRLGMVTVGSKGRRRG